MVCKNCGENAIESDNHHGQVTLVCTACGHVEEEVTITTQSYTDGPLSGTSYCANQQTYLNGPAPQRIQQCLTARVPDGKKRALSTLARLKSVFHLNSEMDLEAREIFNRAFEMPEFHNKSIAFKICLAGSCAYTVMRRRSWPISINNICWALGCGKQELAAAMRMMSRHLDITFQAPPIKDLLQSFTGGMKLVEEKQIILDKASAILDMCTSCWLTTGRSQRICILAATYLAWQSLDVSRSKVTPVKFCKIVGIVYQKNINDSSKEIVKTLVKLAKVIPWLEEDNVNEKNVLSQLNDVLRYQNSLKKDAVLQFEQLKNETSDEEAKKRRQSFDLFREIKVKKFKSEPINNEISFEINDDEIDSYIRNEDEVSSILEMEACCNL